MDIVSGGGTGGVSRKTLYLVNRPPAAPASVWAVRLKSCNRSFLGNPAAALISLWTLQRVL
jgi:hypothetical protein